MSTSPPPAPATPAPIDPIAAAGEAIDGLCRSWRERHGEALCTVRVLAAADEGPPTLDGEVLVASQRDAILAAVAPLAPDWVDRIRVLADADAGQGWAHGRGAVVDLLAAPGSDTLASQWTAGDPPLRLLVHRGDWAAVQAADGTVGWVRESDVDRLAADDEPEAATWRRVFTGRWTQPPGGAWRAAVADWLGTPYRWGGASHDGVDCSGYVQRLVRQVAGLGLPKHSGDQARLGQRVAAADAAAGDLLYLSHRERRIPHVALVVEPQVGQIWVTHANIDGDGVCLETLADLQQRYALRSVRRLGGPEIRRDVAPRPAPANAVVARGPADAPLWPLDLPLQRDPRAGWDWLESLRGQEVHVLGYTSAEGAAVTELLWQEGVRRLVLHDLAEPEAAPKAFAAAHVGLNAAERRRRWLTLSELPVERRHGDRYLEGLEAADAVFVGQAWYLYPRNVAALDAWQRAGRPLHGLMELYFRLSGAPIVAVTGSNGKSTTSRWVEHILGQGGEAPGMGRIHYAGNERHSVQAAGLLRQMTARDRLLLEVSNRHLRGYAPRPEIALITNVLPNHLDEHGGTVAAYQAVKRRLLELQDRRGLAVLSADDPMSLGLAHGAASQVFRFSLAGPVARGAWIQDAAVWLRLRAGEAPMPLLPAARISLPGAHNRANALAATVAAALAGGSAEQIRRGLANFRGLRHRLQLVWQAGGIDCFDDLNSTTPQATLAALDALLAPVVLIAGGQDKGLDLTLLAARLAERARAVLLLPGEGSDRLAQALAKVGMRVERPAGLEEAVARGLRLAQPGDVLLLSPALPGFFHLHYVNAGREEGFRAILRRLTAGRGPAPAAPDPGAPVHAQ
ncbi:MAG: Mur ligase family protein [Anaerolineae bacterium]